MLPSFVGEDQDTEYNNDQNNCDGRKCNVKGAWSEKMKETHKMSQINLH